MDYCPTKHILAIGHEGGSFTIYDLATNTLSSIKGTDDAPNRFLTFATFSYDGATVAHPGLKPNSVVLHELNTGLSPTMQYQEKVNVVAFSPTQNLMAAGQVDGTIVLHDFRTDTTKDLEAADGYVWSLTFSPDGSWLVAGHGDGRLDVWSVDEHKLIQRSEEHSSPVWSVAFSQDGKHLVSGSIDGTLKLWESIGSKSFATMRAHEAWAQGVFSPDGKMLASSGWGDNTVRLWDVSSQSILHILKGHSQPVVSVRFSADGKRVFSAAFDRTVRIWDLSERRPDMLRLEDKPRVNDWIDDLVFSPNGRTLAVSHASRATAGDAWSWREKVSLWHLETGELEATAIGRDGMIRDAAFSVGWQVATVDVDGRIEFWDQPASSAPKFVAQIPKDDTLVALSPSGKKLAASTRDGTIRLWSVDSGELLFKDSERSARTGDLRFAFSPNEETLATGHRDGSVILWDTSTGIPTIAPFKHDKTRTLAFSPDGSMLASGGFDGDIWLWQPTKDGVKPIVMKAHTSVVRRLVFSADGSVLYSVGGDGTVKAWDHKHRRQRGTLENPGAPYVIAFSPDERVLAVGMQSRPTVKLWRAASAEQVLRTKW